MSKRNSEYERIELDTYLTPPHIVDCLVRAVHLPHVLWEPAEGAGGLRDRLREIGFKVYGSDIVSGADFTRADSLPMPDVRGVVTNPPFDVAQAFIERALELLAPVRGTLALLLPCDYDHAQTRTHLFRHCPCFAGQVKLTRRIVWFEREDGKKPAPSEWHSWFVWDFKQVAEPWVRYQTWLD